MNNRERISIGAPPLVRLPDLKNAHFFVESKEIIFSNTKVFTALKENHGVKCGQYAIYDEMLRFKTGQYAIMNRNSATVKYFNF